MSADLPADRRRTPLNRQRVVTETLAMIDEQGIAAVTMRALAARLGVEAMSLYKHVANREALFDAVAARVVAAAGGDGPEPTPARGWRAYLAGLARRLRRSVIAHPNAFPLVVTRPAAAPGLGAPLSSAERVEPLLTVLRESGFSAEQARFGYRALNRFLLGFLWLETSMLAVPRPVPPYDPQRFPTLHRMAGALAEQRFEIEFEAALQDTLDDIDAVLG